jgi:hypothetical protein
MTKIIPFFIMKYVNPKSRKGLVCNMADFIIGKLDPSVKAIIEVTDHRNIFVVSGVIESDTTLNIKNISEEFYKKFNEIYNDERKTFNTIDLIEYRKLEPKKSLVFEFYNTKRSIYHLNQIEAAEGVFMNNSAVNSIDYGSNIIIEIDGVGDIENTGIKFINNDQSIKSEFPYGYSISTDRGVMYYLEGLSYKVFNDTQIEKLIAFYDVKNDKLKISPTENDLTREPFLEIFNKYIKEYDITKDMSEPFNGRKWF